MPKCDFESCNRKVRLCDLECKCKNTYCSVHRLPEAHNCSFDYKKIDICKKVNDMKCLGEKLQKI